MQNYKIYTYKMLLALGIILGSALLYSYWYSKYYPVPLTSRISLDAKLKFIRDMEHKEEVDTIIMGSSIGLNNISGPTLQQESTVIHHVLNLSAFSMEISHTLQLLPLFDLFPHLKRVIYSAQSLDFTGNTPFDPVDIDLLKSYTKLGKHGTNPRYISIVFKDLINCITRQFEWKKKHLAHNQFENLDFDATGSASLHIYGKDINQRRWKNPFVAPTNKKSYQSLDIMLKKLKKKHIAFYLVLEPYRKALVKHDKKLQNILNIFHTKAQETVLKNGEHCINLHQKLHLEDKYFADRIHLNDQGNVVIAKTLASWIDSIESSKGKR